MFDNSLSCTHTSMGKAACTNSCIKYENIMRLYQQVAIWLLPEAVHDLTCLWLHPLLYTCKCLRLYPYDMPVAVPRTIQLYMYHIDHLASADAIRT
jgi:hypothetical protein